MKHFTLVLILAVTTPALLAQATSKLAQPTKPAAPISHGVDQALEAKIRQAWQDWKDKNQGGVVSIMSDEVVEVEADGRGPRDKTATLADMLAMNMTAFSLSDFKFLPLGSNAELATYKSTVDWTSKGQKNHATLAVSEVWVKRGKDWKLLHYQETEMK